MMSSSQSFKFKAVYEYLETLPQGIPLTNMRDAVCHTFSITRKQFYYAVSRMQKKTPNFDKFIAQLEDNGFEVYASSEDRLPLHPPEIVVAVSPQMKRYFQIYGDKISFDLTFSLVKTRNASVQSWKLGVFLGTSSTNRLVPMGIVFTQSMTKESYMKVFQMFFAAVGGQPKVIITD